MSHTEPTTYTCDFKVRDYELDIQGVVNNGVYSNYFEHARHEALLAMGVDFAQLAIDGINLVVTRAEIDYKKSLRSGDEFVVHTRLGREGRIRLVFQQSLVKQDAPDVVVAAAKIIGVAVDARMQRPMALDGLGLPLD